MSEMFIKPPSSNLIVLSPVFILIISQSSVFTNSLDHLTGSALKVTFVNSYVRC